MRDEVGEARASGLRHLGPLEFVGMEFHEVQHVRQCFAGELAEIVRHAISLPKCWNWVPKNLEISAASIYRREAIERRQDRPACRCR